ncbi:kelch-like protein 12 isoform X2 [Clavelina lepadiformis]|uniref:kelch-like protein 12 isoform X2 n=1 Tax=Clavelina lepadiformis TaxID=159417 RepID=UPI004043515E
MLSRKKVIKKGRSSNILNKINSQRLNKKFCDVVLAVDEEEFPTHRAVLAASSEYFDAMFSSKMREQHEKTISITGITPSAMALVLDFIYTDVITLTDENVGEVLQAASLLRLLEVQDIINEYLVDALKPSTCLFFRDLGRLYSLENVVIETEKCLKEEFHEVSVQSDFCKLEIAELECLLSSDEITVAYESNVFEAVTTWVKYDAENRKKYFLQLFKHVRLQLVSLDYISDKVRTETLVRESPECRDLVEDAFHVYVNPQRFELQTVRKGEMKSDAKVGFLLCFGGCYLCMYNISDQIWTTWTLPSNFNLTFTTAVSLGTCTYFCGGMDNNQPTNRVLISNGSIFKPIAPMNIARINASAASVCGNILVFGGELSTLHTFSTGHTDASFHKITDDFEIYEPDKKQWKVGGNLLSGPRTEAATVVVKERVYLLGGYNSIQEQVYPSIPRRVKRACKLVDVYEHSTNSWTSARQMNHMRASFGAAALDNRIYCVGGYQDSNTQVATSEFFEVTTGQWTNFTWETPWSGPSSACKCGGKVYALGSFQVCRSITVFVGQR